MVSGSFLEQIMVKTVLFLLYIMFELQTVSYLFRIFTAQIREFQLGFLLKSSTELYRIF